MSKRCAKAAPARRATPAGAESGGKPQASSEGYGSFARPCGSQATAASTLPMPKFRVISAARCRKNNRCGRSAATDQSDIVATRRPAGPAKTWAIAHPDKELIMPDIKILNPDALGKPLGQYSHMTRVKASEFLFIAGQVAVDRDGKVVGADDFDAQCVQTFANIAAALRSAGAGFGNVVQFTTYLVHSQDIAKFMTYRLREFPQLFPNGAYPPNTLLMVDRLVQEPFLIEVQAVAAL
jgi:enamine deaminase RidA (YjgF/YER057c/UK114 family)